MPAPKYPTSNEVSRCSSALLVREYRGPLDITGDYRYGNFDSNFLLCQIMTSFNEVGRGVIVRIHDAWWSEARGTGEEGFRDKQVGLLLAEVAVGSQCERASNSVGITGFYKRPALDMCSTNPQMLSRTLQ